MNNLYTSIVLDSCLPWGRLLELRQQSKQLHDNVQALLDQVEPLKLETYDKYFLRERDHYVVQLKDTRPLPNPLQRSKPEYEKVPEPVTEPEIQDSNEEELADVTESSTEESSSEENSSETDSSDDDETFTQRRNRLQTTMETTSRHRVRFRRHKRSFGYSKKHRPLRQSFRLLLQRQQPELNTIRKDNKNFSIPTLPESTIKPVRRPYRKSDTLLPGPKRYQPDQEFPIIPLFQKIPLRTLLTMGRFKKMLSKLPDYD